MSNIQVIEGKIEVLGTHNLFPDGTFYNYIRFRDSDGNDQMINNITVTNDIGSYLTPSLEGRFHLVKSGKRHALFAYDNDERRVLSDALIKGGSKSSNKIMFIAWFFFATGFIGLVANPLFVLNFLISIPFFIIGIKAKKSVSKKAINEHLTQYGYTT